ncbi:hypothetical protein PRK78_002021 [Emydomyces testavorans]|uniref:HNH nuclease domain-containing protein n=1 Tax=Emydomyces testavorans TaxID=2070801 RepID=A0AAF0DDJ7_9EURO|nr:hypothetical protein PRK78_002021 [Emydomyces testavorans]
MAHNLELEAQRLQEVLALLQPSDLPRTILNASIGSWIDTRAFILSLLQHSICPAAVTEEFLVKLQSVGFKRASWTVESLVHQFKMNRYFQRAANEFVYRWIINFVLPLMDRESKSLSSTDSKEEYRLSLNVTTREMDRCAITGIYDIEAFSYTRGPFGKVTCMRIIPECIRDNDEAHHFIQVFTGGRISSLRNIIDKPENAILMADSIIDTFRDFYWSLKSTATSNHESTRSTLVVERLASRQVRDIEELPADSPVKFGDTEASLSIPTPRADICRLHFAVARIVNETGALPMILSFCRPLEEPRPDTTDSATSDAPPSTLGGP